jgi:hypothetical protein
MMIGDTEVNATEANGKITGERLIVVSNTLILVHEEIERIPGPAGGTNPSRTDSGPRLRLMLDPDVPESGSVNGLHGLMYMAADMRTPGIPPTHRVDVLRTTDNKRIVIMALDNGPIYSSTNAGLTWQITSAPGTYEFPLANKFSASATIHPSPQNLAATKSPAKDWYVVGGTDWGSEMAITGSVSQPAPVLNITRNADGVVVSWSADFPNYILQANADLRTTNWMDVTNSATEIGNEFQITIPSPSTRNFYRLRAQ